LNLVLGEIMIKFILLLLSIISINLGITQEIFIIEFTVNPEMEHWYSSNWNNPNATGSWKMCNVYSEPDTSSEIVGSISSEFNRDIQNFVLYFQPKGTEELIVWNDSIGDWGYGIHLFSPERSENFIKLPSMPFPKDSWIQIGSQGKDALIGGIESIVGRIVHLQIASAVNLSTNENLRLDPGNYMVLNRTNGAYVIRKEIPSDMPCGEEEIKSVDQSPVESFLIKNEELFDENYQPRIKLAYPKGC
jgi:hypothetical protein